MSDFAPMLKIQISRGGHAKALKSYSKLPNKAFFCAWNATNTKFSKKNDSSLFRSRDRQSGLLKRSWKFATRFAQVCDHSGDYFEKQNSSFECRKFLFENIQIFVASCCCQFCLNKVSPLVSKLVASKSFSSPFF